MKRLMWVVAAFALTAPLAAQDKGAEVLAEMRKALGGDKLESVKALSLEGPFRREMGPRQMEGTIAVTIQPPDRLYRSEEMEMPGGMSVERMVALNGATAWEDVKQRGGMAGGMIVMRGPEGRELDPKALEEARLRRTRTEMSRYLLALLGARGLQPTYVAVAEAPDGKADVLEVKNEQGAAVRLFVDQQTHLPLMLQYQEVRPRMQFAGPGGRGGLGGGRGGGERGQRPDPEEIRRRMAAQPPPAPSTVSLFLADYKNVDGIMLPHRLTQSVDGKPVEEWNLEKVKVNPSIKADLFEKK